MSESKYDVNGDVSYIYLRVCTGLWNDGVALHTVAYFYINCSERSGMKALSGDHLSAAHDSPLGCSSCIEQSFLMLLETEGMRRKTFLGESQVKKGLNAYFQYLGPPHTKHILFILS